MTRARMPGRAHRSIPDPLACEMDCAIGLDATRTFGPPRKRRRDWTAVRAVVAIVLVAAGCALVMTAGQPPLFAINP